MAVNAKEVYRITAEKIDQLGRYAGTGSGKAMLADADVVCEIKNGRVIPKRENIMTFRNVYKMKYKAASFYIAKENKVVYFFCKTEAGLQRRLTNLMLDKDKKNAHWPYKDKATAEHLRYPR